MYISNKFWLIDLQESKLFYRVSQPLQTFRVHLGTLLLKRVLHYLDKTG